MKCERCGKEHSGKYGSGRFCSSQCARSFSSNHVSEEGRKKQKAILTDKNTQNKSHESRLIKSDNFEQDSDGNWIKKPKSSNKIKTRNKSNIHSLAKGKVGELATAIKFINHDYNVFVPLVDTKGIDMIVEKNGDLKKIQVKSSATSDDNSTQFSLRSSNFNMKNGVVTSYNKNYSKKDVDYFALYSEKDEDVYLVKNDESHSSFTIRNNILPDSGQFKGKNLEKVHKAEDYQIDRVLNNIDNGIDQSNIIEITDFEEKSEN